MKTIKGAKALLKNILLGINASESEENEVMARALRDALDDLRLQICCVWQLNKDVQAFDSVFKACGWDCQGLRWDRDLDTVVEGRIVMRLYIVELNHDKTWRVI